MSKPKPLRRVMADKRKKRLSRILRLVADGFSYAEIGSMLSPKISGQRVGQIVKSAVEVE